MGDTDLRKLQGDRVIHTMHPLRLAMWSGPRNISTVMMRAWESRGDTLVWDEPLYAHYLSQTRADPYIQEMVSHYETDWRQIVQRLTHEELPEGKRIHYQRHMIHHLLPHIERDWLTPLTHCFLIRNPAEVLPALARILSAPTLEDTGFPQLVDLFYEIKIGQGRTPLVIEARDVLRDPRRMLQSLTEALEVPFEAGMVSQAVNWLAVAQEFPAQSEPVPMEILPLYEPCMDCYQQLYGFRLMG